jgi:hypothetical protein
LFRLILVNLHVFWDRPRPLWLGVRERDTGNSEPARPCQR